jgi:ABC-type Fe3+-hydroxamate transport system substrate-binding protein
VDVLVFQSTAKVTGVGERREYDDLGAVVSLPGVVRRVVSLVPSLTEAIAVSAPDLLVGVTDWCTHPAGLSVERVRGTKNPDLRRIAALAPDLVICNQEENRRLDVERLRAQGTAVWVTVTEDLDQALGALDRLFTVALDQPRPDWLDAADAIWATPAPGPRRTVAVAIWRDPWMVVGEPTFTSSLLGRLGFDNVFAGRPDRYPAVMLEEVQQTGADLIVLPDEPYAFHAGDGPEAFPGLRSVLVSGRHLTWYGPSLVDARQALEVALRLGE